MDLHSGYADDAVLVDESVEAATVRVNAISVGSRVDADMHINVKKQNACTYAPRTQRMRRLRKRRWRNASTSAHTRAATKRSQTNTD